MTALRAGEAFFHDALVGPDDKLHEGPNAPDIIAISAKYLQQPEAVIRRGLPYFDPQARVAPDDIDALTAWYVNQHMLKTAVKAADVIDMRYAIAMPK
jgi:hypothetical protein